MLKPHMPGIRRNRTAFTLIEVLVVVAIIALVVAILIPSLSRAREQASRAKCLANMSSLGKAVMSFAAGHKGRGQIYSRWWPGMQREIDPGGERYAWESSNCPKPLFGPRPSTEIYNKAWPVAYAPELGITSLKYTRQYFISEEEYIVGYPATDQPQYHWDKLGSHDVFYCPSDPRSVRETESPEHDLGVLSYGINEDLFGYTTDGYPSTKACSADGSKDRLMGMMDRVVRPSEVCMFTDAGHEQAESYYDEGRTAGVSKTGGGAEVPTDFATYNDNRAAYLDGVGKYQVQVLPLYRHGRTGGGVSVSFADGHGAFIKNAHGLEQAVSSVSRSWNRIQDDGGLKVQRDFLPRSPRVTPYNAPLRVH